MPRRRVWFRRCGAAARAGLSATSTGRSRLGGGDVAGRLRGNGVAGDRRSRLLDGWLTGELPAGHRLLARRSGHVGLARRRDQGQIGGDAGLPGARARGRSADVGGGRLRRLDDGFVGNGLASRFEGRRATRGRSVAPNVELAAHRKVGTPGERLTDEGADGAADHARAVGRDEIPVGQGPRGTAGVDEHGCGHRRMAIPGRCRLALACGGRRRGCSTRPAAAPPAAAGRGPGGCSCRRRLVGADSRLGRRDVLPARRRRLLAGRLSVPGIARARRRHARGLRILRARAATSRPAACRRAQAASPPSTCSTCPLT
jgi:hypothetical protein